jgi:hypothetical protein
MFIFEHINKRVAQAETFNHFEACFFFAVWLFMKNCLSNFLFHFHKDFPLIFFWLLNFFIFLWNFSMLFLINLIFSWVNFYSFLDGFWLWFFIEFMGSSLKAHQKLILKASELKKFDSWKRKILTVWKRKFWHLEKENRKNPESLENDQ